MTAARRLAVIVNPTAGRRRSLDTLRLGRAALDRLGAEYRVVESEGLGHAGGEAQAAAQAGETVVALGGDGMVSCLAAALCGSVGALAIIPAGRGNDFARWLGVPGEPEAAVRLALEGPERLVDVGEINGTPFLCIASVGLDSDVNRFASQARFTRTKLAYPAAVLRALASWRPAGFQVVVDGEPYSFAGYSLAVANAGAYGGGMNLVPHADLEDGRLDVVMVGEAGRLRFLHTFLKVFQGTHVGHPALRFLTAKEVEVRADRELVVYADGEPVGPLPATIRVRPRALRVVAPALTDAASAARAPVGPPPRRAPSAARPAGP